MGRLAIISIGSGDFSHGFEVSLEIKEDSGQTLLKVTGMLPANPQIKGLYECWQQSFYWAINSYQQDSRSWRSQEEDWETDESLVTNRSTSEGMEACRRWVQILEANMQDWLGKSADGNWQRIRENLLRELARYPQEIRLIIQTKESLFWKLPWHVWDLLAEYTQVGIGYSLPEFERKGNLSDRPQRQKVRLLAVLGDSKNLNLQADQEVISCLNQAEPVFLHQPSGQELIRKLRDKQGWDIFFFAGHSRTEQETGRIYLNDTESIEIDEFKHALQVAIRQGLEIAIFNSCDGLGLAQQLASLQLPITIVMQEVVPDQVAQAFLQEFLREYAAGQPLYTAVRQAQESLEEFTQLPGATWLPVTFQNPSRVPPTWQSLHKVIKQDSLPFWPQLRQVALTSFMVTAVVMGMRWVGILQPQELWTFDQLLQMQPAQEADQRLLIITISQEDIKYQDQQGMNRQGSLADVALVQLLKKLKPHQPAVIGLDIYRDSPTIEANFADLAMRWRGNNFIDICQVGGGVGNSPEIPPPLGVSLENVGFSDLPKDPDQVVRRQIFGMAVDRDSECPTELSFSFQIAHYYLTAQGFKFKRLSKDAFQIGSRVFRKVKLHSGGYHNLDLGGFEVLLNYRSSTEIAQKVGLKDILNGSRDAQLADLVKGRIILIGTIDNSYGDDSHLTPYSASFIPKKEMPGVEIQAQMVSQIISAVLDQRPIIWWWPQWVDTLWIWCWSCAGGALVRYLRLEGVYLLLAGGAVIIALSGFCFVVLWLRGGWLPLVPSVLAVVITGGSLYWLTPKLSRI